MPKDEAYSRVSDPERYRPLHRRAELLVQRLESIFDVTRSDPELDFADRVVRLVPSDPAAAPISIGWTSFPGLQVRFGTACILPYPHCGCDACDEDAGVLFADLERQVYAVTTGRFREWPDGHEFRHPDGRETAARRPGRTYRNGRPVRAGLRLDDRRRAR